MFDSFQFGVSARFTGDTEKDMRTRRRIWGRHYRFGGFRSAVYAVRFFDSVFLRHLYYILLFCAFCKLRWFRQGLIICSLNKAILESFQLGFLIQGFQVWRLFDSVLPCHLYYIQLLLQLKRASLSLTRGLEVHIAPGLQEAQA